MTTSLRTRFVAAAGIALALGAAYLTNPAVGVGQVTVHPAPNGSGPWGIAAGQHGSMWATESSAGQLVHVSPTGAITKVGPPLVTSHRVV